jgi:hypothetical protein
MNEMCRNECGRKVERPRSGLCNPCYVKQWRETRESVPQVGAPTTRPCGYHHAHKKIKQYRGIARALSCAWPGCADQADEWSYTTGSQYEQEGWVKYYQDGSYQQKWSAWSPWPYDYEPLCRAHHIIKDQKA